MMLLAASNASACTNILVSRGASADGLVMITYNADGSFLALQPVIDTTAAELMEKDTALAREFLTSYSVGSGQGLFDCWRKLGLALFTKYKEFYVHGTDGRNSLHKYPEEWLRRVLQEKGDQLRLPQQQ
jgi:hypothetical protein